MEELTWKFGKRRYVPISQLREDELFITSKHAVKKMNEIEAKRTAMLNKHRELLEEAESLRREIDALDKPFILYADRLEAILERINEVKNTAFTLDNVTWKDLDLLQKGQNIPLEIGNQIVQ